MLMRVPQASRNKPGLMQLNKHRKGLQAMQALIGDRCNQIEFPVWKLPMTQWYGSGTAACHLKQDRVSRRFKSINSKTQSERGRERGGEEGGSYYEKRRTLIYSRRKGPT